MAAKQVSDRSKILSNDIIHVHEDIDLLDIEKSVAIRKPGISDRQFRESLEKGKYDINYVITLLRIIEGKCEAGKLSPSDLRFSLQQSCKEMIAHLETERDIKTAKDPVLLMTCEKCKNSELIFKSKCIEWKCNFCEMECGNELKK